MNDGFAFMVGCLFIGVGLGVGLSCIGDGIKELAKIWRDSVMKKKEKE